jgi:Flp pilus assembly secretin CpaC
MRLSQRFAAWLASMSFSLQVGLVLALAGGSAVFAGDDTIVVTVDQARIVKIPTGAQTLVIGNPTIADVTLQNGVMIVTGKGFGETNFIALDTAGNPVAESMIRVISSNNPNALIVQRGMDQQSYSCAPKCEPTVKLGDDTKFFSEVASQSQAHTAQAGSH